MHFAQYKYTVVVLVGAFGEYENSVGENIDERQLSTSLRRSYEVGYDNLR